jgi:hypothetical protein
MVDEYEKALKRKLRWKVFDDILILFFFIFLSLGGCDTNIDDIDSNDYNYVNENSEQSYWRVCIDGKEFIEGPLRLSINLDFDGKPIPCEMK